MTGLVGASSYFAATVPVGQHYMKQLHAILDRASDAQLHLQLAPDMLACADQIMIAQGFVPRTICPLIGASPFEFSTEDTSRAGLTKRFDDVDAFLSSLTPMHFDTAQSRTITHGAGQADLSQTASEFVTLYALPNLYFHISMAYAILRQSGLQLGKSDFDGFHAYSKGTSFV